MKIRITTGPTVRNLLVLADNVQEAGLFLMTHFRDRVGETMGKMTVSRLIEYGKKAGVIVEKIDHSLRWVELQEAERKKV